MSTYSFDRLLQRLQEMENFDATNGTTGRDLPMSNSKSGDQLDKVSVHVVDNVSFQVVISQLQYSLINGVAVRNRFVFDVIVLVSS